MLGSTDHDARPNLFFLSGNPLQLQEQGRKVKPIMSNFLNGRHAPCVLGSAWPGARQD